MVFSGACIFHNYCCRGEGGEGINVQSVVFVRSIGDRKCESYIEIIQTLFFAREISEYGRTVIFLIGTLSFIDT